MAMRQVVTNEHRTVFERYLQPFIIHIARSRPIAECVVAKF